MRHESTCSQLLHVLYTFFAELRSFFVLSDCFIIFLFDHFLIFCFAKDVTAQNILGGKVINQNMICMLIFKSFLKNCMLVKGIMDILRWFVFHCFDDFFFVLV